MGLPEDLRRQLEAYFAEKEGVRRVILFGSRATSQATCRSDVDLLIVIDEKLPYLERLEKFCDLLLKFPTFEWDLLVWTEEELSKGKDRPFMREILKEGQVIYEREEKS
ncbi:MAG: nucleotidyltransferase domain-containing protein [Thermodesulfobacteria bacterium]|nr:nucleotidyltransferase domain-containing protein [Thermodesulfobacteriota bacterium]